MKWIALLVLTTLSAAPALAEVTTNVRLPIAGTVINPCNGENVDYEGTVHVVLRTTVDGSGGIHLGGNANYHVTGVGQTTGAAYVGNQNEKITLNLVGASTETQAITFRLISKGGADNFYITLRLHITVNANGDVTVVHGTASAECR